MNIPITHSQTYGLKVSNIIPTIPITKPSKTRDLALMISPTIDEKKNPKS